MCWETGEKHPITGQRICHIHFSRSRTPLRQHAYLPTCEMPKVTARRRTVPRRVDFDPGVEQHVADGWRVDGVTCHKSRGVVGERERPDDGHTSTRAAAVDLLSKGMRGLRA